MSRALKCERYDRLTNLIGFTIDGIINHLEEDEANEGAITDALIVVSELLYDASKIAE